MELGKDWLAKTYSGSAPTPASLLHCAECYSPRHLVHGGDKNSKKKRRGSITFPRKVTADPNTSTTDYAQEEHHFRRHCQMISQLVGDKGKGVVGVRTILANHKREITDFAVTFQYVFEGEKMRTLTQKSNLRETVSETLEKAVKTWNDHYPHELIEAKNLILKRVDAEVFLTDLNLNLEQILCVWLCLHHDYKVTLQVVRKDPNKVFLEDEALLYQQLQRFIKPQEIQRKKRGENEEEEISPAKKGYLSLTLLHAENFHSYVYNSSLKKIKGEDICLFAECTLNYGQSIPITNISNFTGRKVRNEFRFDENIQFPIPFSCLPSAVRLTIQLWGWRGEKTTNTKDLLMQQQQKSMDGHLFLVGWVHFKLFTFDGYFRGGEHIVQLWPGGEMDVFSNLVVDQPSDLDTTRLVFSLPFSPSSPSSPSPSPSPSPSLSPSPSPPSPPLKVTTMYDLKVLEAVDWWKPSQRSQVYKMVEQWPKCEVSEALELLGKSFMDPRIREYAVDSLSTLDDYSLLDVLPQLIQCLEYECHLASPLFSFLFLRSLLNPNLLGKAVFWRMGGGGGWVGGRGQGGGGWGVGGGGLVRRFQVFWECLFFAFGDEIRGELVGQWELMTILFVTLHQIKKSDNFEMRDTILRDNLKKFSQQIFTLPNKWSIRIKEIDYSKCKVIEQKRDLALEIEMISTESQHVTAIFEENDHIKNELLVVQAIKHMINIWWGAGLTELIYGREDLTMVGMNMSFRVFKTNGLSFSEIKKAYPGWSVEKKRVFENSFAAYCVVLHVLGVERFPNRNCLVDNTGSMHCYDYFELDLKPFQLSNFQPGITPLTLELQELFGGQNSSTFQNFCATAQNAFFLLQSNESTFWKFRKQILLNRPKTPSLVPLPSPVSSSSSCPCLSSSSSMPPIPRKGIPKTAFEKGGIVAQILLSQVVKVVVVGQPSAGKTTLIRLITNEGVSKRDCYEENTATPGIDITKNERPEDTFSLHFYDFGGQETLFPTHQLFLTHDTLYLITINLSNYDKKYLFYWGEVITKQAISPLNIFLICTHADEVKGVRKKHVQAAIEGVIIDFKSLNIVLPESQVFAVGKDHRDSHINLLNKIREEAGSLVQKQRVNRSWLVFQFFLRQEPKCWMNWEDFIFRANQCGIQKKEIAKCTQFLIDRGVVITRKHSTARAPDLVILDPAWLAGVFSTVISPLVPSTLKKTGLVTQKTLHTIWQKKYPSVTFPHLEGILQMYELMVLMPQNSFYLSHFFPGVKKGETVFFVPSMAWRPIKTPNPEEKDIEFHWPSQKSSLFSSFSPFDSKDSFYEFERRLKLDFIPTGYLQRVLLRLCKQKNVFLIPEVIQRTSYILHYGPSSSKTRIRLTEDQKASSIHLSIRCQKPLSAVIFHVLFSSLNIVDTFLIKPTIISHIAVYQGVELGEIRDLMYSIFSAREVGKEREEGSLVWKGAPDLLLPNVPRIYGDCVSLPLLGSRKEKKENGLLAEGANGEVYKTEQEGMEMVIKVPKLNKQTFEKCLEDFIHEALVMELINDDHNNHHRSCKEQKHHPIRRIPPEPCLCYLQGLYIDPKKKILGLVLNYVKRADLFKFLDDFENEGGGKAEKYRRRDPEMWKALNRISFKFAVAKCIIKGMAKLHSPSLPCCVMHSDLRSANVFLNSDDEFGDEPVAIVGDVGGAHLVSSSRKFLNNPRELAPEMWLPTNWMGYGQSADVYCFGLILWQLFSLCIPPSLGREILAGERPPLKREWKKLGENGEGKLMVKTMKECWRLDPSQRPTFQQIQKKFGM